MIPPHSNPFLPGIFISSSQGYWKIKAIHIFFVFTPIFKLFHLFSFDGRHFLG